MNIAKHALKELVDNAWDADAEHVHITTPMDLILRNDNYSK
jgi:hypothetical protein